MDFVDYRAASIQDAPVLVQFNIAIARETENKVLLRQVVESGVYEVFRNPHYGFYLVAEQGAKVVGSLMVTREWSDWRDAVFWWIQSVYVAPESRRRGIYRGLYKFVRQRAADEKNVCGMRLYVERENAAAHATYRALGMEPSNYLLFEDS